MRYIKRDDINGTKIFIGDILKVRVFRGEYNFTRKNKNDGMKFASCVLLNEQGDLSYHAEQLENLKKPIGTEQLKRSVFASVNLFECRHGYGLLYSYKEKKRIHTFGDKMFLNVEVIGNVFATPELYKKLEVAQ